MRVSVARLTMALRRNSYHCPAIDNKGSTVIFSSIVKAYIDVEGGSMNRRDFLKQGLTVSAGLALGGLPKFAPFANANDAKWRTFEVTTRHRHCGSGRRRARLGAGAAHDQHGLFQTGAG